MSDPATYSNDEKALLCSREYEQVKTALVQQYKRWEDLQEALQPLAEGKG